MSACPMEECLLTRAYWGLQEGRPVQSPARAADPALVLRLASHRRVRRGDT